MSMDPIMQEKRGISSNLSEDLGKEWPMTTGWWDEISISSPLWRKKRGGRHMLEEECKSFIDTIDELVLVDTIPGEG